MGNRLRCCKKTRSSRGHISTYFLKLMRHIGAFLPDGRRTFAYNRGHVVPFSIVSSDLGLVAGMRDRGQGPVAPGAQGPLSARPLAQWRRGTRSVVKFCNRRRTPAPAPVSCPARDRVCRPPDVGATGPLLQERSGHMSKEYTALPGDSRPEATDLLVPANRKEPPAAPGTGGIIPDCEHGPDRGRLTTCVTANG